MIEQQSPIVFFVPGLMGSTLRYRGPGEYGQPVDEEVWGANLWNNIDLLATNPARFASSNIEASEVILEMRLGRLSSTVYRRLIEYCTANDGLGLTMGTNFFSFPYDWRRDNRQTAEQLLTFIQRTDPTAERRIHIIAHSMGGIVARLMLLENPSILERTDLFFQIASPIQGSAKAYYTLKKHPRFHKILDEVWKFFHRLDPGRWAQLQITLQGFESLYQLLPPREIITLYDRSGKQYAALDPDVWPVQYRVFVDGAQDVHAKLVNQLDDTVECVYSNTCKTDMLYLVNQQYNIIGTDQDEVKVWGDGTVTSSSASAHTLVRKCTMIESGNSSHTELCYHPDVLQLLRQAFHESSQSTK